MKNKAFVIGGSALALVAAGGGYAAWHQKDTEVAKRVVLDLLVDPDSAKFYKVEACADGGGGRFVLGEVNSRNRAGGMTGKVPFIVENVQGEPLATIYKEEPGSISIANSYADEVLNDKGDPGCTKLYQLARQHLDSNQTADGGVAVMNATEGMDFVGDLDEPAANMEPLE